MSGREILKSKFQEELAEFVSALRHVSVEDAIDQAGLFAAINREFDREAFADMAAGVADRDLLAE